MTDSPDVARPFTVERANGAPDPGAIMAKLRAEWRADEAAARQRGDVPPVKEYVYFIRVVGGPVKIGLARDPLSRLADLQMGNPDPLELVGLIEGGRATEKALHREFAEHRVRGEWFRPVAAIIERAARHPLNGR